ncbi:guanine nucleotide binding protein, alpha subunit [Butyriboletus roseoflavus]|nr:guanine nucleotide binding protein, alpha subunit [Butyriboletus roseoflavus]
MMRTPSIRSQDDPLSIALRPPATESETDRQVRLQQEAEARRISEQIDEELRIEREKLRKSKSDVKLRSRASASPGELSYTSTSSVLSKKSSLPSEAWDDIDDGSDSHSTLERQELSQDDPLLVGTSRTSFVGSAIGAPSLDAELPSPTVSNPTKYSISDLRRRLLSLVNTEPQLADRLSGGVSVSGSGKGEVFVRSGWQARTIHAGQKLMGRRSKRAETESAELTIERPGTATSTDVSADTLADNVATLLDQSREDITTLWEHPVVRALISRRKLKLDEWSEFFLNNIARISAKEYIPSTADDILHARIQTMGVAEHIFDVDIHGKTVSWHLFDVGGARGQRHSWVPYFDDANAIIFVSPISAFDQYLEEDPRTNRIDDSLQLFTQICSNQLLKNVHLVLFLNKTDILRKKLQQGLSVSKYILSYGDRPNEYESVVQYFRAHFLQVHRRNNENRRVLYTHLTNVTVSVLLVPGYVAPHSPGLPQDTKATQSIIGNVRDSIFRGYLQSAALV